MGTSSSRGEAKSFTIGVLGSARLSDPDPRAASARELGRMLAEAGWHVMTGGYGGLMAEVSHGAAQVGGLVTGLPMQHWAQLTANEWNHELRWSRTYPERLGHLLGCDAIVALDGGIGTLAEASVVWSALQTEPSAPPLVTVGRPWRTLLAAIASNLVVDADDMARVIAVDKPADVVSAIRAAWATERTPSPRG